MTRGLPATFIIWPERRWVSRETIATWYADAVANQEVAPPFAPDHDTAAQAAALDDAGKITLGSP